MKTRIRKNEEIDLDDEPIVSERPRTPVPAPSSSPRWVRLLFRPRVLVLLAAVVIAVIFAPRYREIFPDLARREEYRLRTRSVKITEPPRWIPIDFIDQVIERAKLPETISVLDPEMPPQLAKAFRAHPWVEEVTAVRKAAPAMIEIELVYRRPVAMVEVQRGMYPVDAAGVLLPPADFSPGDTQRYPIIQNVQTSPQGPSGTSWGDVTVSGGAKLAALLGSNWRKLNLAGIRATWETKSGPPSADEVVFELTTTGGSRIIWGRAPGSTFPGELTADQKMGRLEKYHNDFGRFDQPHGPYEIDIRHWQEISRRPLSARANDIDRQ